MLLYLHYSQVFWPNFWITHHWFDPVRTFKGILVTLSKEISWTEYVTNNVHHECIRQLLAVFVCGSVDGKLPQVCQTKILLVFQHRPMVWIFYGNYSHCSVLLFFPEMVRTEGSYEARPERWAEGMSARWERKQIGWLLILPIYGRK